MADTPKDKRENALKRIKALQEERAAGKIGGGSPGAGDGKGAPAPKNAPRHASTGHRPQGG